ncbi:transporter substrate-binding domain-containing protein [Pseudodesulfovibrio cashew]|uniref:Transporter substrate-binding domain-containing protein n=1 Tax=Pseudodesulfovibrio cashew TaxID=2678688 RepID=A0A6I6J9B9_9BACT|nr:transporter substrate-binding domain-containing protein [Pseudodesulfovibrio cashew]QGY38601.1 transporter substrate-binding domain-containing protein [Pseudodesulfovibrio cashew]
MSKTSRRHALKMIAAATASLTLAPSFSLAGSKTLVCNWNGTFPPYSMEQGGRMTGILVDCLDDILGKRMGYTLVHRAYPWSKAQELVQSGEGDTLCTNPTDEREQFMIFSEEAVIESAPSIFCDKDNPLLPGINAVQTLDDLKAFRQVDYKGNGWARKTFPPSLNVRYVDTLDQAFRLIKDGEADIFVGNGLAARYALKQSGLTLEFHARELPVGETSAFHFGLRKDYPDAQGVVEAFGEALDEAQLDGTPRKIIMSYL